MIITALDYYIFRLFLRLLFDGDAFLLVSIITFLSMIKSMRKCYRVLPVRNQVAGPPKVPGSHCRTECNVYVRLLLNIFARKQRRFGDGAQLIL